MPANVASSCRATLPPFLTFSFPPELETRTGFAVKNPASNPIQITFYVTCPNAAPFSRDLILGGGASIMKHLDEIGLDAYCYRGQTDVVAVNAPEGMQVFFSRTFDGATYSVYSTEGIWDWP